MFHNGLVLKNFGQSTDELLKPRLQWASGQLSQQRHHLILVCPFAIEVLTEVLLHYATGDQVGEYEDRVYAANDVVIVLDDDIVRYTSLQTQYPLGLFLHYLLDSCIGYKISQVLKGIPVRGNTYCISHSVTTDKQLLRAASYSYNS